MACEYQSIRTCIPWYPSVVGYLLGTRLETDHQSHQRSSRVGNTSEPTHHTRASSLLPIRHARAARSKKAPTTKNMIANKKNIRDHVPIHKHVLGLVLLSFYVTVSAEIPASLPLPHHPHLPPSPIHNRSPDPLIYYERMAPPVLGGDPEQGQRPAQDSELR